jgi:hypothetical protein
MEGFLIYPHIPVIRLIRDSERENDYFKTFPNNYNFSFYCLVISWFKKCIYQFEKRF